MNNLDGTIRSLFNFSDEDNFDELIKQISNLIVQNELFQAFFYKLLDIFRIISPRRFETYVQLKKSIFLTPNYKSAFWSRCHYIQIQETKISNLIKNDDLRSLQKIILDGHELQDDQDGVNLLAISAFYGSVQCFQYLVLYVNMPQSYHMGMQSLL